MSVRALPLALRKVRLDCLASAFLIVSSKLTKDSKGILKEGGRKKYLV